ncbi:hypothetical protein J2X12_004112 [Pseudarthrobacter oxydans]|uniref:Tape measure protein n=1 Tax=Pseudarthrobacter oxydans TaxID=1671 RepID=A0AAW8NJ80_PSEOX|nr:hypothetical protein [Pseudarthrobacter oxydans]MDR6794740.1 hypothetical protein [Pseudarthrobacter oxydans]MDR7166058.1 hypothetical protein [Pseudarthrobacter oxydans]
MASNSISILIQAKDNASSVIRGVSDEMERGSEHSGKYGRALASMGAMAGRAAAGLTVAGAAAGAAGGVVGLKFNSAVEQAETKLNAFMKDGKLVAETLAWVKKEAAATQFSFTDMADAAANLTPVAKTSGKSLKDLVRQAEILAAINPAEGLTGATFSLREALSGDWVSIVDRFNLPRQRINELKEQGVPAMEIISRTLQEMGIDYSLVSEQGKTAAARFDQIKDKLTMMAGAASKPLFDKLSESLNGLNEVDFTEFGNRLADAVQWSLDAGKNIQGAFELFRTGDFKRGLFAGGIEEDSKVLDVILNIREAFQKAWDVLSPAIADLTKSFREKLLPALQDLWKELGPIVGQGLKDLAVIVGVNVVAALWLAAKALDAFITGWSGFFKFIAEGIRLGKEVVDNIVNAWNGLMDFFQGLPGFFDRLWSELVAGVQNAVNSVGAWFAELPGKIAYGLGLAAGWLVAFVTVDIPNFINSAINWFHQLPGQVAAAVSAMYGAARDWFVRTSQELPRLASEAVNAVANWFRNLPGYIAGAAAGIWGAAVGAFNGFKDNLIRWAADTVNGVIGQFTQLPGRISSSVQGALNSAQSNVNGFFGDLGNKLSAGFAAGSKRAIGTSYAPGGLTLVGENGPELVNLPQGSQVTQAYRTRNELASGGSGPSINIENLNVNNGTDYKSMLSDIGFSLRLAS